MKKDAGHIGVYKPFSAIMSRLLRFFGIYFLSYIFKRKKDQKLECEKFKRKKDKNWNLKCINEDPFFYRTAMINCFYEILSNYIFKN
ncbi:hypothetical protein BpHYR1_022590 [Brachionus plicatilis]|uniref:Uncharacterized protein n=1 Tax=Brachionus plicatilis TaxID=10195 RepID=A0A3M7T7F0_BRAPC|nr:hypothetical protein BpHYR1_022590 [Brachionus plicatilis]